MTNLVEFIQEWQRLNTKEERHIRFKRFFDAWQSCRDSLPLSIESVRPELNLILFQNFVRSITPLLNDVKIERRSGSGVNIWEVSGLGNDEVRISSVLAWFLNCNAEHGQSDALLAGIIEKIANKPLGFPTAEDIKRNPYWTRVESCASGDKSSRIDIEIEGESFLLFIEVKIYAPDTNNQLDRYIEIGRKKSGDRPWGIIFLTPGRKAKTTDDHLVSLCWNDIADVFRKHATTLHAQSFSRHLLTQFSQYITKF